MLLIDNKRENKQKNLNENNIKQSQDSHLNQLPFISLENRSKIWVIQKGKLFGKVFLTVIIAKPSQSRIMGQRSSMRKFKIGQYLTGMTWHMTLLIRQENYWQLIKKRTLKIYSDMFLRFCRMAGHWVSSQEISQDKHTEYEFWDFTNATYFLRFLELILPTISFL